MAVDVVLNLLLSVGGTSGYIVFLGPAPVVGPDVDGDIVDVRTVVKTLHQCVVLLAAHISFVAGTNHVLRVDGFDKCGSTLHVLAEIIENLSVGAERPRLVADLPGIDGVRILVAFYYAADVLLKEFHRFCIARKGSHGRHIHMVTILGGMRLAAGSRFLEPGTVAVLAPLPGIVQEKHALHPSLGECLERGVHTFPVLVGGEDSQIGDSVSLERIQFSFETGGILHGKAGGIPHVSAYEVVGGFLSGGIATAGCHEQHQEADNR